MPADTDADAHGVEYNLAMREVHAFRKARCAGCIECSGFGIFIKIRKIKVV
ncbi:MAG: hypothetical protein BWX99_02922 [Deltaproteobacteria bacterium ADurb.Bin151]|nr:MAG: hypothetical protein BWX99_02922 [Deltaproteobacteria bacterium ADurb.Bin151]